MFSKLFSFNYEIFCVDRGSIRVKFRRIRNLKICDKAREKSLLIVKTCA